MKKNYEEIAAQIQLDLLEGDCGNGNTVCLDDYDLNEQEFMDNVEQYIDLEIFTELGEINNGDYFNSCYFNFIDFKDHTLSDITDCLAIDDEDENDFLNVYKNQQLKDEFFANNKIQSSNPSAKEQLEYLLQAQHYADEKLKDLDVNQIEDDFDF